MSYDKDWTTWAGDNPEEAKIECQALMQRVRAAKQIAPLLRCINEDIHEFESGVCLICDVEDEDYEPSDAQIPGTYEIRKAAA